MGNGGIMFDWNSITWICHICGVRRPDAAISVRTYDKSKEYSWPPRTMMEIIRFCNDNPKCVEKSKMIFLMKQKENDA